MQGIFHLSEYASEPDAPNNRTIRPWLREVAILLLMMFAIVAPSLVLAVACLVTLEGAPVPAKKAAPVAKPIEITAGDDWICNWQGCRLPMSLGSGYQWGDWTGTWTYDKATRTFSVSETMDGWVTWLQWSVVLDAKGYGVTTGKPEGVEVRVYKAEKLPPPKRE